MSVASRVAAFVGSRARGGAAPVPPLAVDWAGPSMTMDAGTWTTEIEAPFTFVAPAFNGAVHVVTPDGAGGAYVGGEFTEITDTDATHSRDRIAHLDAFGKVTSWDPGCDNPIYDIKVIDADYIAVAKRYQPTLTDNTLGGFDCRALGIVDRATGIAQSWDPGITVDVNALFIDGDWLWNGRSGGTSAVRRYSIATKVLSSWNYTGQPDPVSSVSVISEGVLVSGSSSASSVVYQTRDYVTDNLVTAFEPLPSFSISNGPCGHHVASDGSVFLFGLRLTALDGISVKGAARVNSTTGDYVDLSPAAATPLNGVLRMGSCDSRVAYMFEKTVVVVNRGTGAIEASFTSTSSITPFPQWVQVAGVPLWFVDDNHVVVYGSLADIAADFGGTVLSGSNRMFVLEVS